MTRYCVLAQAQSLCTRQGGEGMVAQAGGTHPRVGRVLVPQRSASGMGSWWPGQRQPCECQNTIWFCKYSLSLRCPPTCPQSWYNTHSVHPAQEPPRASRTSPVATNHPRGRGWAECRGLPREGPRTAPAAEQRGRAGPGGVSKVRAGTAAVGAVCLHPAQGVLGSGAASAAPHPA